MSTSAPVKKTDELFRWIEQRERTHSSSATQWGRVLDAGTGRHSLQWLLSVTGGSSSATDGQQLQAITELVAVTGEKTLAEKLTSEFQPQAKRMTLQIYAGNWADDTFLSQEQPFDVIIADYLVGAIEGFAAYFQDEICSRLTKLLKPGGRLYLIGLQPLSESTPSAAEDASACALVQEMARVRDACILLAGRRCYREFPITWSHRQLEKTGLTVNDQVQMNNVYRHETVQRQLQVAKNQLVLFRDNALAASMQKWIDALDEQVAKEFQQRKNRLCFGFDYVLAASKPI